MTTNFIGMLLPNSPDYTVNTGFSTELYDADGGQTIIVQAGASLELLGALGANTIKLAGVGSDWQVYRDGSNMIAVYKDGSRVEVPANTTAQTIVFSDVSLGLRIAVNGSTPAVMLGNQTLDTGAAPVGGVTPTGSAQKAPWTLIMPGSAGLYASDGSADGSKFISTAESLMGRTVVANANQTAAVVNATSLYGTDGTAAGTVTLGTVPNYFGLTYYKIGNKIVMAHDSNSYLGQSVVTDGTKAGTVILSDASADVVDPVTQTLWGGVQTGPYGRELFKTTLTGDGAEHAMVKDIKPGSASGLPYFGAGSVAVLSNGRLVFAADDGTGSAPWVSDGTTAGTVKLADLNSSYGSQPYNFTVLGDKVAFTANVDGKGTELVVTDGTSGGTKIFDISTGSMGSGPTMLGVINGTLYFTAQVYAADYTATTFIYSTDGSTVRQIAKVSAGSALLGLNDDKAFLKSGETEHGQELWVVNLADGTTQMVKDILAGSGSALADTTSSNTFMVGSRLAFSAYTSPTDKAFFLSDGSAAGTWQIGKEAPRQTLIVGENIFFTDSEGVHVVDNGGHVTLLAGPQTSTYYTQLPMQSDKDQVYFLAGNNALYSASGSTVVRLADSDVAQFKVVGENGVFFIKAGTENTQNLWFSDGNVAGTSFVRTLPAGFYDLADAAGLHTAGTPLPSDSSSPLLAYASVSGSALTLALTDDSPLDGSHTPPASAFHLSGTGATITGVTVNATARTVVLSLSEVVKSTDKVLVSYTDPTTGNDIAALQDTFGNDAAGFVDHYVQNLTPDNVAPILVAASVDGKTLTLSYLEAGSLDASQLPSAGSFKLEGTAATVSAVSVDTTGTKLILTLSQAVLSGDSVKLSYTDPTDRNDAAAVQDKAGNDAASVTAFAVQNTTLPVHGKAPWTLLVSTGTGVYASDGTAAGSKFIYASSDGYSQLVTNADHTAAVIFSGQYDSAAQKADYFALGVDGSGAPPIVLAHGLADNLPQAFGKYILVTNNGNSGSSGLITDGTAAGTHVLATLRTGWMDPAHLHIWSTTPSDPYGYELYLTTISETGAETHMVKDISPGSPTGFVSGAGALLLANGKLVFIGSDPSSGAEPWVSDGAESGTVRLAELQPGANSSYFIFQNPAFGSLAAFSAIAYGPGNTPAYLGGELVITDGTIAGTHVLDIAPGPDSSSPQMIGALGGTLYFTASTANGGSTMSLGLFSTDGATFTRLADLSGSAAVLGRASDKIFFSLSDTTHGQELWVADGSGAFSMVKDILPGTGSGMSGSTNPLVVGDKLVFQAYTSGTTQKLFISDGTAAGTVALGPVAVGAKSAGSMLVYGDGTNIYGLDAMAAVLKPNELVTGTTAADRMQADSDQVFFSTLGGDLYATDGTSGGTAALGHSVTSFKVVGENSLYFVEQISEGTGYSLNYSDGTVAGTYFVSNVSSDFVNHFDSAVFVHTVGVPPVQH
jgi:uncharacterized repeat protein (TIGR02059 family)